MAIARVASLVFFILYCVTESMVSGSFCISKPSSCQQNILLTFFEHNSLSHFYVSQSEGQRYLCIESTFRRPCTHLGITTLEVRTIHNSTTRDLAIREYILQDVDRCGYFRRFGVVEGYVFDYYVIKSYNHNVFGIHICSKFHPTDDEPYFACIAPTRQADDGNTQKELRRCQREWTEATGETLIQLDRCLSV